MHISYVKHPTRCYYIIHQTSLASRSRACHLKLHTGVTFCSIYKNKNGKMTFLNCTVWNELSCTPRVWHQLLMPFSLFPFGISAPCATYPDTQKPCILVTIRHKTSVTFATKSLCFGSEKAGDIWRDANSGLPSKGCACDSSVHPWSLPLLALSWLILCCVSFSGYLIQRVFKV